MLKPLHLESKMEIRILVDHHNIIFVKHFPGIIYNT